MTRIKRFSQVVAAAGLLTVAACGQTPDTTQKARGVLSHVNVVLGMTIVLLVIAVGFLVGAVAFDRFVRTRRQLDAAPAETPVEEQDEVIAGITVGRASVPRWLYAFYVLIPLFALAYVFSNVSVQSVAQKTPAPSTPPPGPVTEATVIAAGIKFDVSKLTFKANSPVTVNLDNKDAGVPHTFTVWKSDKDATANNASGRIADTGTFQGTKKLTFKTPGPGSLYFNCTIHPTSMFGTIDVV